MFLLAFSVWLAEFEIKEKSAKVAKGANQNLMLFRYEGIKMKLRKNRPRLLSAKGANHNRKLFCYEANTNLETTKRKSESKLF